MGKAVGYVKVSSPGQAKGGESLSAYSYSRFSTLEQEKGDSLRRQIEQSEAYCQAHGLTLDDSLRLTDRGLSAFHGIHRTKGALGEFHRLVEQGEVEPGSVLLVESLDRLSREQVLDALTPFTDLIRAGIKVVTLADGMSYDKESINSNFGQLLMSLVIMSRAHEESAMKSVRLGQAWKNKRKEAYNNGHKLTAKCPAWLTMPKVNEVKNAEERKFTILPEAVQVVNWIFQMKLEGKGSGQIEQILNAEKGIWVSPPRGKGKKFSGGWRKSYINKILSNRAVIGEFTPYKKVEGRRIPQKPIPDYYPAIVDKDHFNQVQALIKHNRETSGNAGGRNGTITNLFGHIAKCYYCGGPMAFVNKGKRPKGGSYLVCDRARRGFDCKKLYLRYNRFEPLILSYCKGLDPTEILPDRDKKRSELATLRNQLQSVEGELAQIQAGIEKLLDNLELGEVVEDRLRARQEEKAELEAKHKALTGQIAKLSNEGRDTEKQLDSVKELIDKMSELEGQERIILRLNLRNQLRRLINRINFLPDKNQVGLLFRTGEKRLLIVEGEGVRLLDVQARARRVPSQLWEKPLAHYR